MVNKRHEKCPHCQANMMIHKYGFNKALAVFLYRLASKTSGRHIREAHIKDLGLSHSEKCNFNRVQHWGLAKPAFDDAGKFKQGMWQITPEGVAFVKGIIKINKHAWVFRNQLQSFEGPEITMQDAMRDPAFLYREDYLRDAKDANQAELF